MNSNSKELAQQGSTTPSQALLDEASAWIARLSNDQANQDDHQRFALWLSESPQHRAAYDEVETLWLDLGCIKYTNADATTQNLEDQPQAHDSAATLLKANDRAQRFSGLGLLSKPWTYVASLTLCACVAVLMLSQQPKIVYQQSLSTAIGEQHTSQLADGSSVELNTNTQLAVRYTEAERRIELFKGEAHFQVSKDAQRPFIVDVPGASVIAIGTAFNIEIEPQQTLVTVTEGVIRVEEQNDSALRGASVTAKLSDRVTINPISGLDRATLDTLDSTLAWRERNLIFKNQTLAQVVAELNRYSERKIKIADASLAFEPMSGVFKISQPAETLQAIKSSLDLQSKQQGRVILLYK